MPGTRLERVQELFAAAVERPSAERAAFLAAACGDDAGLRAEVEDLLAHAASISDNFLTPPPAPPDLTSVLAAGSLGEGEPDGPDPLVGRHVGRYEVRRVIARGGMAIIYEALQERSQRLVALKVMRWNPAWRSALRRFEFEGQVLARLRHPNIAQIYEAGTHYPDPGADREGAEPAAYVRGADPLPFFAMEYIPAAQTVRQYAAGQQLDTRQRLELFLPVCDAVEHGHQKGVIHRDLKPANILVGADGVPKVIDFGIARATDSDVAITTQQTKTGDLIGTVQYMSPEQCDADPLDIDTRSDVYSLGVVLYELLTETLPYDAANTTIYRAIKVIKESEPRRPSQANRGLGGNVEAIILKALSKERSRRYRSAGDLANDIRRHLRGEPTEARPPNAWERGIRWIGRHPQITTVLACVCIAVLTIVPVSVALWLQNMRPYRIALSTDRHEARLVAFSDRVLRVWQTVSPAGFTFGELVEGVVHGQEKKLALLGFALGDEPGLAARLCAFDASSKDGGPLWTSDLTDDDLPEELQQKAQCSAAQFVFDKAILANVFDDVPGDEIVACFNHDERSPRVIQIYDLAGNLLYQVWHDGGVQSMYWMGGTRLLVLAATDARTNWAGGQPLNDKPDSRVVLALRPRRDYRGREFVSYARGAGPTHAVWCLQLHPNQIAGRVVCSLSPPHAGYDRDYSVLYDLTFRALPESRFSWTINDSGQATPIGGPNDEYKKLCLPGQTQRPPWLPHHDSLALRPWVSRPADSATVLPEAQ